MIIIGNEKNILDNKINYNLKFETKFQKGLITNLFYNNELTRILFVDNGKESQCYLNEDKKYELITPYLMAFNLMFLSNQPIKDVLMIGGGRIFLS